MWYKRQMLIIKPSRDFFFSLYTPVLLVRLMAPVVVDGLRGRSDTMSHTESGAPADGCWAVECGKCGKTTWAVRRLET